MAERDFIARLLAPLAINSAARGLVDDAAVWTPPLGRNLVFTHDILAAGVHYLPGDPPSDVAWKLLAVNLSDLAAMAATPAGVLLGLGLSAAEDDAWREAFVAGLARALETFNVSLWGGDTVTGLDRAVLGLTAIGWVEPGKALGRAGARPGDVLYVSGSIGDAGLGLAIAQGKARFDKHLLNRFRRPTPRLALGAALGGVATAGMDVSDGLLIDAQRLAAASGVALAIDLEAVPLSRPAASLDDLLARVTAGDDYELLFSLPDGVPPPPAAGPPVTAIGRVCAGVGLSLSFAGQPVSLPARLGWEHA
ncbi:thiamine-phosphate kinase [Sandarakinorhabdus oryzae]|uniref:thiamine-phosphate kinase n=1 Tax=Sandarakinorhabdus oryzae TaxID=2675220 RepID=UPI0012E22CA9|nr:thiamine-phosphate kinase [Sandarakinorhabdus oryzae]